MTLPKRFTWPCGCIFITEPLSHYQWHPCPRHGDLPMSEVITKILDSPLPEVEELERTEVKVK